MGLLLAACLAFSVGLIASSAAGTNSATFRLAVASQAGSSTESIYAVAAVAPDALALTATARRNADPWYGAPAGGPNGRCFVLIDRHNHKTGGTTMRDIMLQNARYGDCHYWGYGQDEPHWSAWLAEANKLLPTAGRAPGGQPIRLCLEAHFPVFDFMTLRVPAIAALRDAARAPAASAARGCSVVLTTRVREPVSFYLSFYKWDIAGRVESGRDGGAERFGKSFLEWRPLNLQSNALLNAMTTEWASNW